MIWATIQKLAIDWAKANWKTIASGVAIWLVTSSGCLTVGSAARKWASTRAYNQGYRAGQATCRDTVPDDGQQRRRRWFLFASENEPTPWLYTWFGADDPVELDAVIEEHTPATESEVIEAPE